LSIYHACDIRGDAAVELTPEMYRRWGRRLGSQLPPGSKFVVGGDVRDSTPAFLAALLDGLRLSGLDAIDLGLLPSPMIYYAKRRLRAQGCAVVTASSLPASQNGLKWQLGDHPPGADQVSQLAHADEESDGQERPPGTVRTLDVTFDYVACLQETFVESMGARLHVVLDPMHGSWSGKARRYLHAIFPQCLFSAIHDEPDPRFGGRAPDCSPAGNLDELSEAVYRHRAHLGAAFDGDGDRLSLVDGEGVVLGPEEAVWTMLHCLGDQLPGERLIYDRQFSDRVAETARLFGAEPVAECAGTSPMRAKMADCGALFGAELGGRFYHRALGGADDALYTLCLVIEHLARRGLPLSQLRRECPAVCITPDLCVPVAAEGQGRVFDLVRAAWAQFPQHTTDGLRIDFPGGWAMVRRSTTEPALRFRFEGLDWHALDDLVERFCDVLPEVGDELWARYRAATGPGA